MNQDLRAYNDTASPYPADKTVVELFEARRPAETAVMSEIDGTVTLGPIAKGKRKLIIVGDDG